MKFRRPLTAGAAIAIAVGTAVVAAPSASAGEPIIWHQAVAVASSSSPCPVTTAEEAQSGWSEWTNSWAQWPNDGKGGNVCTRSITWAYEADAETSGVNCVLAQSSGLYPSTYWVNFLGGWSLARGNGPLYEDSACTDDSGTQADFDIVYAPGGEPQADARCHDAFGTTGYTTFGADVWACLPPS